MQSVQSILYAVIHGVSRFWILGIAVIGLLLVPVANSVAGNPYLKSDDSWINLSGTVDKVSADSFRLNYGDGSIIVEMDDGDRDADGYKLLPGDEVSVTGRIDNGLFERTTIEAAIVHVKNIGTTFYASAVDDEELETFAGFMADSMPMQSTMIIGEVTRVSDQTFTVNSGMRAIRVDVSDLAYNPLDDIDRKVFTGRELRADFVVEYHDS